MDYQFKLTNNVFFFLFNYINSLYKKNIYIYIYIS